MGAGFAGGLLYVVVPACSHASTTDVPVGRKHRTEVLDDLAILRNDRHSLDRLRSASARNSDIKANPESHTQKR
jgi:hypothetical protein